MASIEEQLKTALQELRKEKERKFDQSVDLIVNLQKFEVKKNPLNLFISVPHKIKDKKIAAFFEARNPKVDTIIPEEFKKFNDKKEVKKLVNKYDFFMAQASVMQKVAATFGRVLGPVGKMPSPQLGLLVNVDDKAVDALKEKVNHSIKIRAKEPSIKTSIGKQSMDDDKIVENIMTVYNTLVKNLPRDQDNVKNIEIKLTMTKPVKIKLR